MGLAYDSLLPPGRFAVLFGRKYASAPESSRYALPAGTFVFAVHRSGFRSGGLSWTSAQVSLVPSGESEALSTFNAFRSTLMSSGETRTWQRVRPDSSDAFANWIAAPPTPGAATVAAPSAGEDGAGTVKFTAANRRLIPGCDSLAFINLAVTAPAQSQITVRVFSLCGRPVRTLCDKAVAPSVRYLQWDGRNSDGAACPPGIYVLMCLSRRNGASEAGKIPVVVGGRCGE